jgi:hypothetical protein
MISNRWKVTIIIGKDITKKEYSDKMGKKEI